MSKTTIYYDGDCPLCTAEIAYYERRDTNGAFRLVNVADPNSALPAGTVRTEALARFHVVTEGESVVSGAAAFVEVWRKIPGWRWLARLARIPGVTMAMEGVYRIFLPLRPLFVRAFVAINSARGGA